MAENVMTRIFEEIDDALIDSSKWRKFTFNAMTRQGVRTEALWCKLS